jgi:hypothetical protein
MTFLYVAQGMVEGWTVVTGLQTFSSINGPKFLNNRANMNFKNNSFMKVVTLFWERSVSTDRSIVTLFYLWTK